MTFCRFASIYKLGNTRIEAQIRIKPRKIVEVRMGTPLPLIGAPKVFPANSFTLVEKKLF